MPQLMKKEYIRLFYRTHSEKISILKQLEKLNLDKKVNLQEDNPS